MSSERSEPGADDLVPADLWELEIIVLQVRYDLSPEDARLITVVRWMSNGDLRPLLAEIRKGPLDEGVLNMLGDMIEDGRIRVVHKKGGRPNRPDKEMRDLMAAAHYIKHSEKGSSDAAFKAVADEMGMSEEAVRAAVTFWRKNRKNK